MQLSSFAIKSNDTKENVELFKQNNTRKLNSGTVQLNGFLLIKPPVTLALRYVQYLL